MIDSRSKNVYIYLRKRGKVMIVRIISVRFILIVIERYVRII